MGTGSLCAQVGVLIISAALQMSVAGAKVKSASQLLSVTLSMRARSLRPHTRLQFVGWRLLPLPHTQQRWGFPGKGTCCCRSSATSEAPHMRLPIACPVQGSREKVLLCAPGKRKAQFRRKKLLAGFVFTPSQLVPRLQQPPVYHPHLSGEGAQLDLITCKTPARASHVPGLP